MLTACLSAREHGRLSATVEVSRSAPVHSPAATRWHYHAVRRGSRERAARVLMVCNNHKLIPLSADFRLQDSADLLVPGDSDVYWPVELWFGASLPDISS